MQNPKAGMRPTTLATILVVVGLLLAVGASVPMFFARFFAEAGPGLGFVERLMVATPMAIAIALLIGGANHGLRAREGASATPSHGWRALFAVGGMIGVLAALITVGFLFG